MRNKTRVFLCILAAAFLIGLTVTALSAGKSDFGDLLLVAPTSSNSSFFNAERLEELNEDQFLLTYEILSVENVRALNSNYDVTLKKTNYTYRSIMGFGMLSGSFFTEEDQKRKQKAAVLNEAAALAMFGNLDVYGRKVMIGKEEYTVTGVMDDENSMADRIGMDGGADAGDDRYNIYIPASVSGQNPRSFAVRLEEGMTAEWVKSVCKNLTMPESGYTYVPFGALSDLVNEMYLVALKSAAIFIFLLLMKRSFVGFRTGLGRIKELRQHFYFAEILQQYPDVALKLAAVSAVLALTAILILNTVFSFVGSFLLWNDTVPLLQSGDSSVFGEIAAALEKGISLSMFFLTGFLIDLTLLLWSFPTIYNGRITLPPKNTY